MQSCEGGSEGLKLVTRDKLIMRGSCDDVVWECCNYSRQLPLLEPSAASKDDPRVIHDVLCIIWSFGDNRKLKLVQIFPNMTWHNTLLRTLCHTIDVTHRDIRCQMSCGLLTDTFHDIVHDMLSHWVTRLVRHRTQSMQDTLSDPVSRHRTQRVTAWQCVMWWIFPFVTSLRVKGSVTK